MAGVKIVITGASGQLGSEFCRVLSCGKSGLGQLSKRLEGCDVLALNSSDCDVCDQNRVFEIIERIRPFCVVNCAAFTDVDACETKVEAAFKVNAVGARNLAMACERVGSKLVQISTDYVFDGMAQRPYVEGDVLNPQTVYGKSKALGEEYVKAFCSRWFVVRTAWLYGKNGKNFVKTIARLAQKNGRIKVVADQFGSPTNVEDLVFAVCGLMLTEQYGIFHGSGNGSCSWHEFASEIISLFKIGAVVESCCSADFERPAKRPKFSVMENLMFKLTIGDSFRHWKQALEVYCRSVDLNDLN